MNLPRRLVAEGIGTALLLAAVVGSGIMGERLAGGNVAIALLANTITTGSTLVALILTFGPISGAHFNPAVTIADASQGGLSWGDVPPYIGAQLAGAVAGVFAAHLMFGERLLQLSQHVRAGGAQLLSEFVATFWTPDGHLGLLEETLRIRATGDRPLHHRGVLVYGVDVVCESSRHRRSIFDEHVCRHPPGRRARLHRRRTRRRARGHSSFSLARTGVDQ
jgi:hypothetical protein